MRVAAIKIGLLFVATALSVGCNQNPFVAAQAVPGQDVAYVAQMDDLRTRATALDSDNRELHAEVAREKQEKQLLKEQIALLQDRLRESSRELQVAQQVNEDTKQQFRTLEASTRRRGGATITANNSIQNALQVPDIPGFEVKQDGDVIRIEIPADRLFHPRSDRLVASASYLLDRAADAITRYFPNQKLLIEGHTDNTTAGTTSNHVLSSAQANAVREAFVRRNRIPERQMNVAAYGANFPRVSNATPAGRSKNRRIELVIYPDTIDER